MDVASNGAVVVVIEAPPPRDNLGERRDRIPDTDRRSWECFRPSGWNSHVDKATPTAHEPQGGLEDLAWLRAL